MWVFLYLVLGISQLGRHFWPDWTFVYGIKIDYLSPIIYLTDLVWIGAIVEKIRNEDGVKPFLDKKIGEFLSDKGRIAWIVLIIINILVADRWQVALYKWFKWWQLWWWVRYLNANKKVVLRWLPWMMGWWIGIEAILGLGQVVSGGSLEGIFYWLGERRFSYMTAGVAKINWMGDNFVRAYGTFSHPNSLAGFLLVMWLMLKAIWAFEASDTGRPQGSPVHWSLGKWIVNWLAVVGVVLAGSRLVWSVAVLVFVVRIKTKLGLKMVLLGIILMVSGFLFNNRLSWLGGWSSQSMSMRMNLNVSALRMVKEWPVFGVGLGNFLVELPEFLGGFWVMQPVHNVFLLLLVELGVVGCLWLGLFLKKRIDWSKFGWVWMAIFFMGMFDHYWLTLPQNMFLLSVVMGLSLIERQLVEL